MRRPVFTCLRSHTDGMRRAVSLLRSVRVGGGVMALDDIPMVQGIAQYVKTRIEPESFAKS